MNNSEGQTTSMLGRLIRGAALMGLVKIFTTAISFASTIILARLLIPEDFGLVAIAMTLIMLITSFSELSLSNAIVQLKRVESGHYDTAFTLGLIRSVVIVIILIGLAGPVARLYGDPRLENILYALTTAALVTGFSNPKTIDFIRRLDFRANFALEFAEKMSSFLVAITFAFLLKSYWALIISFIAASTVRVLISYFIIPYLPRFSLSKSKDLLAFSVWVTLGGWVQTLSWRSDPLTLGYFITASALGQYSMAGKVTDMATTQITSPVAQILFPAFSRIQSDKERLRKAYIKALAILAALCFPLAAGLAVLAEPIVSLVLGNQWLPVIPLIQMLAIVTIIISMQHVHPIAMATGNTRALLGRDIRAFIIRMPLFFGGMYLGHKYGIGIIAGAIIGRGITAFINTIWNMQLIDKIAGISIRDHMGVLWRPIISAMAMALTVKFATAASFFDGLSPFIALGTWVCIGAATYLGVLVSSWIILGKPDGAETTAFELFRQAQVKLLKGNA